ncbi:MAG: ABC transporter substrate-binding protein [Anaerolineales bacterium]|nr:ABC transporter substrate-binding protein [Anaerolineales bacterium]
MFEKKHCLALVLLAFLLVLVAGCQAEPEVVEVEKVVTQVVEVEKEVTKIVAGTPVVETVVETVIETVEVEKVVIATPEPASDELKTLVVAIEGDIETLDPDFSRYPTANMANLNVYEQFFRYGRRDTGNGYLVTDVTEIEGAAIESWDISDDRMTAILHVRQGVKFHNTGNPMTADDIIFWYEKGRTTLSGIEWNLNMANIESMEKVGDYDVQVNFSQPLFLFFMLGRDNNWGVVDSVEAKKHATDDDPFATEWLAKNYAGSGEYWVESWDPGVQMVLRANEDYWAGKAYFDRVILRVIPDSSNRALLLSRGEVDIAFGLSPDQIDQIRDVEGVNAMSIPSRTKVVVRLNCSIPPFDNVLVRQAAAYLVPYDVILNDIYRGRARPMHSVLTKDDEYVNESFWEYEYNPEKAKELLAEAGLPDGFEFDLNIKEGEEISSILAVTLQTAFKEAGVTVNIKQLTNAIWSEQQADGTHQATLWGTGSLGYINDPWYVIRSYKTGVVTNRQRFSNPRIDELYDELQVEFDPVKRQVLADEFQKIIVTESPVLFLANIPIEYNIRSDIGGFVFMQDSLLWFYNLYRME